MAEQFQQVTATPEKPSVPIQGLEIMGNAARRLGALGQEKAAAIRQGGAELEKGLNTLDTGLQNVAKIREQHDVTQDITHGFSTATTIQNSVDDRYKQFTANLDPNDLTARARFHDEVITPALEQWKEGFQTEQGKRWAAEHGAAIEAHYNNRLVQDMSKQAGQAAQTNMAAGNAADVLAVRNDPTNLPLALDRSNSLTETLAQANPELRPALEKAKLAHQREIGLTGVKSLYDSGDTEHADAYIKSLSDRGLLTDKDVAAMDHYRTVSQTATSVDAKGRQATAASQAATKSYTQATSYGTALTSETPAPDTATRALNDPDMDVETKGAVIGAAKAVSEGLPPKESNVQGVDELVTAATKTDPRARTRLVLGSLSRGEISKEDANRMISMTPGEFSGLSAVLTLGQKSILQPDPGSGVTNPARVAAYTRFQHAAVQGKLGDGDFETGFAAFQPTHEDAIRATQPVVPEIDQGVTIPLPPADKTVTPPQTPGAPPLPGDSEGAGAKLPPLDAATLDTLRKAGVPVDAISGQRAPLTTILWGNK